MREQGMIVHGLNTGDAEWVPIVWGIPPHSLGRVPQALLLLKEEYPKVKKILFGSGASEKDGLKEGAYTIKYLFDNWHRLREFDAFKKYSWIEMLLFKRRVIRLAEPELKSKRTSEELEFGIPILYRLGCTRVINVTEGTHSSRACAHGQEALKKLGLIGKVSVVPESSVVTPEKVCPEDVVVFEPRADVHNEIVPNLRRIFRISGERRSEFNEKLDTALTEMGV